ncbi:Pum2, partial [Symbiodinium pilosum]
AIGNYSVQHCLEYGNKSCRAELTNMVLNHFREFALDPNACGVVNKALIHGPPQQRMMLAILIASDLRTFLGMAQMQK